MSKKTITPAGDARPVKRKREAKGRMRNFLMFLPNMVVLLGRLLKDARVPTAEKALFVAAIVYVISPIDLIPDIFPSLARWMISHGRSLLAAADQPNGRRGRPAALVGRRRHRLVGGFDR